MSRHCHPKIEASYPRWTARLVVAASVLSIALGLLLAACRQDTSSSPIPTSIPSRPTDVPLPGEPLTIHVMTPPASDGPLPALLAEISGSEGAPIEDILLDKWAGHLYVLDSSGQVHILDASTYGELATIGADPQLVPPCGLEYEPSRFALDETLHRLYISISDAAVLVVDTGSLIGLDTLTPGGPVAVDSTRGRFYVGTQRYWAEGAPNVRIYDSATLKKVGEIPLTGVVGYNPAHDEIGILGPDRIHLVDADSLEIKGQLCVYGDCSDEGSFLPMSVGTQATDLHILAGQNLIAV